MPPGSDAGLVARVLIDSPLPQLDHPFDYSVPAELADAVAVGVRVKVPFGSGARLSNGYVLELAPASEAGFEGTLSPIEAVASSAPVLSAEVAGLARRVADRSGGTASDVVRLAVPSRQVRVEKAWLAAGPLLSAPTVPDIAVTGYPATLSAEVAADARLAVSAIPRLALLPSGDWVGHWAVTLAELAASTLASGRSAILAVPDYRDQWQLEAAVAAVVPAELIASLDARQPDAQRYRSFLRCLEPRPIVAIGNRSSLYAPVSNLGLIALWDDGDPLYAEPLAPYAHSRDVALVRQELADCALVLLGHSRSVEAQRLVEIGWLRELAPERAPRPRIVPTAKQSTEDPVAQAARIPSTAWREARTALETGPVLVQVASPGYAPWLACGTCGEGARCLRCHGPLGVSRAGATPTCRLCGAVAADWRCENCQGRTMRSMGAGSGRTAEELGRAFPRTRIIVADGEHTVLQVDDRPALVVATRGAEPVASGGYRAVLLLDGERMLARESLRVGEDCLRWWSNAAALAAPGAPVLLAGASGPVATALASWNQASFASSELADRRALRFPPAVRVASVVGDASEVERATAVLADTPGVDVLGPVPIGEERLRAIVRLDYASGAAVAGELRAEVVKAATRRRSTVKARGARGRPASTLRVRFDDPEVL